MRVRANSRYPSRADAIRDLSIVRLGCASPRSDAWRDQPNPSGGRVPVYRLQTFWARDKRSRRHRQRPRRLTLWREDRMVSAACWTLFPGIAFGVTCSVGPTSLSETWRLAFNRLGVRTISGRVPRTMSCPIGHLEMHQSSRTRHVRTSAAASCCRRWRCSQRHMPCSMRPAHQRKRPHRASGRDRPRH